MNKVDNVVTFFGNTCEKCGSKVVYQFGRCVTCKSAYDRKRYKKLKTERSYTNEQAFAATTGFTKGIWASKIFKA